MARASQSFRMASAPMAFDGGKAVFLRFFRAERDSRLFYLARFE
jgi:hypothetical protein